ncbi:hypothetical protein BDF14DRAFT_1864138 [Spinellus fusiger]|nr:hypothetical protein BDF14DRAFT_1864138 [Spinellus fusiger]
MFVYVYLCAVVCIYKYESASTKECDLINSFLFLILTVLWIHSHCYPLSICTLYCSQGQLIGYKDLSLALAPFRLQWIVRTIFLFLFFRSRQRAFQKNNSLRAVIGIDKPNRQSLFVVPAIQVEP